MSAWRREFLSDNCWRSDDGWPKEIACRVEHNCTDYLLYLLLRGRYWEGYIIKNARTLQDLNRNVTTWSSDQFRFYWQHFEEYDGERALETLASMFQLRYGRTSQLASFSNQSVLMA
jgi:hypothetical protein